jgi:hypothetical protein
MRFVKDLQGFLESEIDVLESEMKDFGSEEDLAMKLKVLKDILKFLNEYSQEFENKNKNKEVKK